MPKPAFSRSLSWLRLLSGAFAALCAGSSLTAQVIFEDDFDDGTSGTAWTERLSGTDASVDYAFDYSTLGIPPAPNSAASEEGGTTVGMRFLVNLTEQVSQGISTSPNGGYFVGDFRMRYDAWMNYHGLLGIGDPMHGHFGVCGWGTNGTDVEWLGAPGPSVVIFGQSGNGAFADDFRGYVFGSELMDGNFSAGGRDHSLPFYQNLFPSQPAPASQLATFAQQIGSTQAGEFAFAWHQVEVIKEGDNISWYVDGALLTTVSVAGLVTEGKNIFFGYSDTEPMGGVGSDNALNTFIVDNVVVEQRPDTRVVQDTFALDLSQADAIDATNVAQAGIFGGAVAPGDQNNSAAGFNVPVSVVSISGFDFTGQVGALRLETDLTTWNSNNTTIDPEGVHFRFTIQVEGRSTRPGGFGWLNGMNDGHLGIDLPIQPAPNDFPTIDEGESALFEVRDIEILQAPPGSFVRFKGFAEPNYVASQPNRIESRPTASSFLFRWIDTNDGDATLGMPGPAGFSLEFEIVEGISDATTQLNATDLVVEYPPSTVEIPQFARYQMGSQPGTAVAYEVKTDQPDLFTDGPTIDSTGTLHMLPEAYGSATLSVRIADEYGWTEWVDCHLRIVSHDLTLTLPMEPDTFDSLGDVFIGSSTDVLIDTDQGTIVDADTLLPLYQSSALIVEESGKAWRVFCVDGLIIQNGAAIEPTGSLGLAFISRGDAAIYREIFFNGTDGTDGADGFAGANGDHGGDGTDAGSLAFIANHNMTITELISVNGGHAGHGGDSIMEPPMMMVGVPGDGGDGGNGGVILVSGSYVTLQESLQAEGGNGGNGGLASGFFGAGGQGGVGGYVTVASHNAKTFYNSVLGGTAGNGFVAGTPGPDGILRTPDTPYFLGATADFRRAHGMATIGTDDGTDWSGDGLPNIYYLVFGLGDPAQPAQNLHRLPRMNGNQFSYVLPDSFPNLSIVVQHSQNLQGWENLDAMEPQFQPISDFTSEEEGIYVRRTLTFAPGTPERFLRLLIIDNSIPTEI